MIVSRAVVVVVVFLASAGMAQAQTTIHVAAGGNLQTALNNAASGDTITLEAGATFTSATGFTLPAKVGSTVITVRTVTADGSLPAAVNPTTYAANPNLFAIVQSTHNAFPALTADAGDKNWRFIGIVFEMSNGLTNAVADVVRLGDNTITNGADLPENFTIERCVVRAASGSTALRGLQMQVKNMVVRNSWFTNIRSQAAESHTMSAWNSPGPFLIEGNYIEAAAIGVLFGGAAPAIAGLVNSDITFRWNYVTRPLAWETQSGYGIKNLFELKNAQRVHVYGNTFEHNWPDAQSGYAIVLTVRANSATGAPQSTVRQVLFERNIVRHTAAVFNILGLDNQTCGAGCTNLSQRMQHVTIRNNLIYDVDRNEWRGPSGAVSGGHMAQIDEAPEHLTVEQNTFQGGGSITGNIIVFAGTDHDLGGFVYRGNIAQKLTQATGWPYDSFGVFGNGVGEGNVAIAAWAPNVPGFPNTVFTENVLAGCSAATYNNYPGNLFPTVAALHADFVNAAAGNFRLVGGSAFAGKGMNQDEVEAAIGGATLPTPVWAQVSGPRIHRLRMRLP